MTYKTPTVSCTATLEIKKSEFFGFGYPITSRDELMFHVEQLQAKFPDARHICYGYIIGDPNNTTSAGFYDDGEPSGTAGKPILNVLQHKAIGNCTVIVVRYFGGIKLGAGGLTRAYSSSAQMVVNNMTLQDFIPKTTLTIATTFAHEAQIRHLLHKTNGQIVAVDYHTNVLITVIIANQNLQNLEQQLSIYGTIVNY
ncbi:hypothetical protein MOMA_02330 [Moraxella macacae 0408225]|uniref:Impact N-terminal domain-containing protein n=1 Tax=Moraxella macacae 0408225 TaxID=1230338 RepID=L2F8I2_9GAMM|nr:YigZ family protein [Moraxella macacae]ELA09205.1 hypothetical protein MOMA_02330 [Moraxella macacae 0408225]